MYIFSRATYAAHMIHLSARHFRKGFLSRRKRIFKLLKAIILRIVVVSHQASKKSNISLSRIDSVRYHTIPLYLCQRRRFLPSPRVCVCVCVSNLCERSGSISQTDESRCWRSAGKTHDWLRRKATPTAQPAKRQVASRLGFFSW